MIQRLYFLAHAQGEEPFDADRLRRAIQSLNGLVNWREGANWHERAGILFQCELETGDPRNIRIPIRVMRDLRSASIGAFHDDGLRAALEIQRNYGAEIYAFSEEASPKVIALSTIKSPEELAAEHKIKG